MRLWAALVGLLPAFAAVSFAITVAATVAVAGDTLGYDFLAYHAAASRVLSGEPAYDMSFATAGGFGLFYYPPTFVPLLLPLGLLAEGLATSLWIAALVAAVLGGIAAMPVSARTRWLTLLLAAWSWPVLYALKLGQVGPILMLLFALGWRWLARPSAVGLTSALGAAIKIQPGLVLGWALLTRRWTSVAAGLLVIAGLTVLGAAVAGLQAWTDFLELARRLTDPITTPHNLTIGALAYRAGVAPDVASVLQWLAMALAAGAFVVASLRSPAVPAYLVTVVASQLLSPILWDHYAMLLLLPAAWLIERGHWWGVLIPLVTSVVFVGAIPDVIYAVAFWGTMIGLIAVAGGAREPTSLVAGSAAGIQA